MEKIEALKSETLRYAGFWIRFWASMIDTLVLALPLGAVVYMISGGEWLDFSQMERSLYYAQNGEALNALHTSNTTKIQWELIFEISMAAVIILFWKRWAGATPGKKMLGIHVVDAKTHLAINNKQAIIRYIGYLASTLILLMGFIMVAFRKDKRALHDLMAETVVIYK